MQNLFERFLASEARFSSRVAVIVDGESGAEQYTYADVKRLALAAAALLRARGLAPGDRCALLAENHTRWCAAFLGILEAGAIAVPFDTTLKPAQVATLLRDSGSRALFVSRAFLDAAREAAASCPELRHILVLEELTPASDGGEVLPGCPAHSDDLAVILYTSGTTADPKGVALTHGNLLAELDGVLQVVDLGPTDRILGVLPLFHALALITNFWLPLAIGANVVFLQTVSATEILRALRERQVTAFCVVPQFFYLLHRRITEQVEARGALARRVFRLLLALNGATRRVGLNLGPWLFRRVHTAIGPQVRLWVSGGSRFDLGVARELHRLGLNLLQGYGLTECAGAATITPPRDNRVGSIGKPLPGVEVKLLPAELVAQDAPSPYPTGEIALRGPIVMKGYWNRPDATAAVLRDGWLLTGDLGCFDPDGHLYITGRKKEVIVLSSGKNIYPEELEAHYLQSPYIKEICVLGRTSQPGEPLAERLHAIVVPNFDVLRERKIVNTREILRYEIESLSIELPSHKRILSYDIWPQELPRTTTRKLKRFEIEQMLRAREAERQARVAGQDLTPADRAWLAEPRIARAGALIARAARYTGELHPEANLELDLGLDSMQRVELAVALEQEFGIELDEEVTSRIFTVRELVQAVLAPAASASSTARPQRVAWEQLLAQAPEDDPGFVHILKPKRMLAAALFALCKLVYALARVLLPLRVEGLENLPRGRPYILSPNHQSYLDVFLLVSVLPYADFCRLFFLGTSDVLTPGWRERLGHWVNAIAVDPDANLVRAMQAGAFGLRHGKLLVLFPEGERSIDGEPKTFKKGATILSTHLRVPIVPVALHGIYEVWPRGRRPQGLFPVHIRIAPPLEPPSARPSPEDAERLYAEHTARLRNAVVEMFDDLRGRRLAAD